MSDIRSIALALYGKRIDATDEYRMQDDVGTLLSAAGIAAAREVCLSDLDRIDFLVDDIGIECKVQGSPADVARQVLRYLQYDRIASLVLITARAAVGRGLPERIMVRGAQKRLRVIECWRGML